MQNVDYGLLNFRIYTISLLLFSGLNIIFDFQLYHLLYFIGVFLCFVQDILSGNNVND